MKALSERAATRVSGSAAPSILGDIIILARKKKKRFRAEPSVARVGVRVSGAVANDAESTTYLKKKKKNRD